MTDQQLQTAIGLMVGEHGAVALKPAEMNALVGLHRAWLDRKPYISWVKQEGMKISGEVWAAKPASLRAGGRDLIKVDPQTGAWAFTLPADLTLPTLVASDADSSSTLDLNKAVATHAAPRIASDTKAPASAKELQDLFKRR